MTHISVCISRKSGLKPVGIAGHSTSEQTISPVLFVHRPSCAAQTLSSDKLMDGYWQETLCDVVGRPPIARRCCRPGGSSFTPRQSRGECQLSGNAIHHTPKFEFIPSQLYENQRLSFIDQTVISSIFVPQAKLVRFSAGSLPVRSSYVEIVPDYAAGRRVFRGSPVSPTFVFRHCSILTSIHPSSVLKTSMLRAAQISCKWRDLGGCYHRVIESRWVRNEVWSSVGSQGRGKWEIPDKTRRPAPSSGVILTCEDLGGDIAGNRIRWEARANRISTGYNSAISTALERKLEPKIVYSHRLFDFPSLVASNKISIFADSAYNFRFDVSADLNRQDANASECVKMRARVERGVCGAVLKCKGGEKRETPEKTRLPAASYGTIPTFEFPGATPPGHEPGSPWWEATAAAARKCIEARRRADVPGNGQQPDDRKLPQLIFRRPASPPLCPCRSVRRQQAPAETPDTRPTCVAFSRTVPRRSPDGWGRGGGGYIQYDSQLDRQTSGAVECPITFEEIEQIRCLDNSAAANETANCGHVFIRQWSLIPSLKDNAKFSLAPDLTSHYSGHVELRERMTSHTRTPGGRSQSSVARRTRILVFVPDFISWSQNFKLQCTRIIFILSGNTATQASVVKEPGVKPDMLPICCCSGVHFVDTAFNADLPGFTGVAEPWSVSLLMGETTVFIQNSKSFQKVKKCSSSGNVPVLRRWPAGVTSSWRLFGNGGGGRGVAAEVLQRGPVMSRIHTKTNKLKEQHPHCTTPCTTNITLTPSQHRHRHQTHENDNNRRPFCLRRGWREMRHYFECPIPRQSTGDLTSLARPALGDQQDTRRVGQSTGPRRTKGKPCLRPTFVEIALLGSVGLRIPHGHNSTFRMLISGLQTFRGATVAERLARSPLTKANRVQYPAGSPDLRKWESSRTMPFIGGFSRDLPFSPRPFITALLYIHSNRPPRLPRPRYEIDRSRWLRTTNLRVPTLNCFSANTTSENGVVWRVNEESMEQHRNLKGGGNGRFPRKHPRPTASSGTISTCENLGIEPGSPWVGGEQANRSTNPLPPPPGKWGSRSFEDGGEGEAKLGQAGEKLLCNSASNVPYLVVAATAVRAIVARGSEMKCRFKGSRRAMGLRTVVVQLHSLFPTCSGPHPPSRPCDLLSVAGTTFSARSIAPAQALNHATAAGTLVFPGKTRGPLLLSPLEGGGGEEGTPGTASLPPLRAPSPSPFLTLALLEESRRWMAASLRRSIRFEHTGPSAPRPEVRWDCSKTDSPLAPPPPSYPAASGVRDNEPSMLDELLFKKSKEVLVFDDRPPSISLRDAKDGQSYHGFKSRLGADGGNTLYSEENAADFFHPRATTQPLPQTSARKGSDLCPPTRPHPTPSRASLARREN
ncbi:hypothetical protein PR048_032174 [Dryococelus australis]|uniref:Uncharacterized protein n=1 Tax=Dryococelus australis TaxID=614101 RepID=A0ABQ9G1G7_9NEOP|nr:hypothetical protein PR048_032174 [Dryococelus australis]